MSSTCLDILGWSDVIFLKFQAAMKKEFYEVQLPAGLQVYEDKFVPNEGFFLGDSVSCLYS